MGVFKASDVLLRIETSPVREGAAPSLGWGPRRSAADKEDHDNGRMLSSRAWTSSLCIPAVLGCGPATPTQTPVMAMLSACAWLQQDTLPLWAPSTGSYFHSILSFPFYFTSSFLDSSCLYFSTKGIASSQLNQPSCSFPSEHQHCHCATFRLTNSQEILPYNLLFILHIVKSNVLAALLLLQEHFLFFCPFPPFILHTH